MILRTKFERNRTIRTPSTAQSRPEHRRSAQHRLPICSCFEVLNVLTAWSGFTTAAERLCVNALTHLNNAAFVVHQICCHSNSCWIWWKTLINTHLKTFPTSGQDGKGRKGEGRDGGTRVAVRRGDGLQTKFVHGSHKCRVMPLLVITSYLIPLNTRCTVSPTGVLCVGQFIRAHCSCGLPTRKRTGGI